ncbi:MAG: ferrous iron transport protein B [bacterium]
MHTSQKNTKTIASPPIIVVGNPNVGKSVIFGLLTGSYVTVSNYPGTTVEVSKGQVRLGGHTYRIIDTPGTNNLIPTSEDERVTRDMLLAETCEAVLQVADTKNLKRALFITLQLAEMGLPLVLDLNMIDEARERRVFTDAKRLGEILGIPIVPTIATQRKGMDHLRQAITQAAPSNYLFTYDPEIENAIEQLLPLLPQTTISKRSLALMILAGDPSIVKWLRENLDPDTLNTIDDVVCQLEKKYSQPIGYVIDMRRMREAERILTEVVRYEQRPSGTLAERLGRLTMHPLWGLPILTAVLFLMYKFVGEFGAGACVDFLENVVFAKLINPAAVKIADYILPLQLLREFLVGEYGVVTMALTYSLAIVLPIVGTFFLFFGLMEDSGYLPRLAIISNRIFTKIGLNGKAVLPMVLGLGCDTMATMTARILESKRDRLIVTLLLALGVPCSAQLGVIMGMLAKMSPTGLYLWLGVVIGVILIVGYAASRVLPGEKAEFVLEIPPLRVPKVSNIVLKTTARLEWYLKEAVPLFILGTFALFMFDKLHILGAIERAASPVVVKFLGLPTEATAAFLIGFLRRDYGAAGLFSLSEKGMLDGVQTVVALVTITLFVPCIAQFFMMVKERGTRAALGMIAFIFPFAFLVGGALNYLLHFLQIQL